MFLTVAEAFYLKGRNSNAIGKGTNKAAVEAFDLSGNSLGQWIELFLDEGELIDEGFAPVSYEITTGVLYAVIPDNWQQYIFDHWENDSTDPFRLFSINQDTTITAYFKNTDNDQNANPEITITTVNSDGVEIFGKYIVLYKDGKRIDSGYAPETFEVISGETYDVKVHNYKGVNFDYWDDGSNKRQRTFTISADTEFIATYKP